jgi:hypothetical protein
MIAALLLLMGCARFDEAKELARCQKAHPNDEAAADKCFETAVHEWEQSHSWLARASHRRSATP